MKEYFEVVFIGCLAALAVVLFTVLMSIPMYISFVIACDQRWENSGFKSEYGFFKGCMVQLKDGRWINERFLRKDDI